MPLIGTLDVTSQGFGAMGLSHNYGHADEAESRATLDRVIELGITLIDTANVYGEAGHNERLVGEAIRGRRTGLAIASKFGIVPRSDGGSRRVNGDPAYARQQVEGSLRRLGVEQIDLYYVHRIDPTVPIEETVGELARLKQEGKIANIGLSEATAETIRRAHQEHPIAALQSEYSLWTRDVETEILPLVRELDIKFVAFSPLGRGFLAGANGAEDDKDVRQNHPRFHGDAAIENAKRRAAIEAVATRLGNSIAQVSLAWVLSKGVVPIPGTRHIRHLESNWAANDIALDAATVAELEAAFPLGGTVGARFPATAPAQGPS
ncbi:aldo/keto reductase [Sphingomonas sp. AP4-R1]|uniref:aldo/keto reductase n=1 Tax=Sphingomonas sp. AP4-R1 TaxID=2735134 RepID=UPI001493BCD3|nr:aldo/keto reductase [Sphingomonas sp. AP4-R1]QJU57365.1 aldo/keto reductase [Sphingomonas sp. AP4-R1]